MTSITDHSDVPLAIVGMACRLPGAANLDEYWRLIIEGRSAVGEVPADRLNREIYYDPQQGVRGKSYTTKASLLSDRNFDRKRCPLPDEVVNSVDYTHLLMTEVAADSLRHAGYDPFNLPDRNASVFIGHAQGSSLLGDLAFQSYLDEAITVLADTPGFTDLPPQEQLEIQQSLLEQLREEIPYQQERIRSLNCNMVSGTVAKAFGLTGSWLALNSACSSSLLAMLMGARALQRGRSDMVIVGGASDCKAESLILFSNARTLTKQDSRPFDADADGLVMAEGYVSLVMKTLDKAIADGDPIQAVVRGLGVATDGRGKSLWAPRKEGQIRAMKRAYRNDLDVSKLQYIECHATATQVGDATELETIGEVLKPVFPQGKQIPVTSVKANIGHALEAAGGAGLIKTVLCMQHGTFPAAINIRQLNPKVDWENAPFFVPQQDTPWQKPADGSPRLAAVNAFGIGGLNMHAVIEEYTERTAPLIKQTKSPKPESADDRAIAIIGMGCISAGSSDISTFWKRLVSGEDPKCEPPADRLPAAYRKKEQSEGQVVRGGFITDYEYDWRKHRVPPKQVNEADPLQFMFLDASEQALNDAGYDKETVDRELCGVVIGTEFGGDFFDQLQVGLRLPEVQIKLSDLLADRGIAADRTSTISENFANTLLKQWPALIDETGSFTTSTLASRISKTLDLKGGAVAIDSGSTSGLAGLSICIDALLSGDNDLMVCAAGQRKMGPMMFETLEGAGSLSGKDSPKNILDAEYDGVAPSEGVGAIVLKRLADAKRDGDPIRAVIRGMGIANHDSTAEAITVAMNRAAENADVELGDVGILNIDTDENETDIDETLGVLFDAHRQEDRKESLVVSSATDQLGHAGGAASMLALLKTGLEVQHAEIAGAFNLQQPRATLNGSTEDKIRASQSRTKLQGHGLGALASWSKGQAYYVILDDGKPTPTRPEEVNTKTSVKTTPRIIRFGAGSLEQLQSQVAAATGNETEIWQSSEHGAFQPGDRARMAVVATSPESLSKKLGLAVSQLGNSKAQQVLEQQGIFCREILPNPPRVAFLFPGQGSQYEGMLRDLVERSPAAEKAATDGNRVMQQLGYPTLNELAWNTPNQLGKDIWQTQISMLLADLICLAALREQDVSPDLVLGHSYGEFAALYAAGVWDFETAVQMTKARCDGISAVSLKNAGLLATSAPPDEIKSIIAASGCQAYLANFNAPDQTVVGGKRKELEQLAKALTQRSHPARILAVPAAFHTPLMTGSSRVLEQALQGVELKRPNIPFISTVNNNQISDPDQIRRNLGVQLTTPVRYAPLIEQLALETPTVFIEVGPQQTLTKLNRRILSSGATVIASDNPNSGGPEQILCVKALLECLGETSISTPRTATVPLTSIQSAPTSAVSSTATSATTDSTSSEEQYPMDDIPHFDATERRRTRMRTASDNRPDPTNSNGQSKPAPQVVAPAPSPPVAISQPAEPVPSSQPPQAAAQPVPQVASESKPKASVASSANAADLESFLINFVVDQTGYPPEVVELDVDLEADLGIDSIKKAQLFGELQEYFEISAAATELSLDDFPTLRHVLNFLVENGPAPSSTPAPSPPVATSLQVAPVPSQQPPQVASPPAPQAATESKPHVSATSSTGIADLEEFLINFVVEQTGYPPEVVELDVDLEADLGIDSIKKAQLFGELQEYFEISAVATELSLDDFPTLRHVLNFLSENGPAPSSTPEPSPTVATSPPAESVPTSQPSPVASKPVSQPVSESKPNATATSAANLADLESFLINFVVEQTGYPPEVVELDVDLEADLGIDSIKKAQLFGELQEYFEINAVATELSLDDFPTLRHVLNFLVENGQGATTGNDPPDPSTSSFPTAAPAPAMGQNNEDHAPVAASHPSLADAAADFEVSGQAETSDLPHAGEQSSLAKVGGTPYEMGWSHGQQFQPEIRKVLRTYVSYIGESIGELPGSAYCAIAKDVLSADELDELQGIADAVESPLSNILAHHFASTQDLGLNATQCATVLERRGHVRHGLRVAPSTLGPLRAILQLDVFLRTPVSGIPHLAVMPIGTTHLLGGVNAAGIGITISHDSNAGQPHGDLGTSALVREILCRATSLESAIEIARETNDRSPWSACISDRDGKRLAALDFDGHALSIHSDQNVITYGKSEHQTILAATSNRAVVENHEVPSTEDIEIESFLGIGEDSQESGIAFVLDSTANELSLQLPCRPPSDLRRWSFGALPSPSSTEFTDHKQIADRAPLTPPNVTSRFELEMRDAPLPPGSPTEPIWAGAAIILGANEPATALIEQLQQANVTVYQLDSSLDIDNLRTQLDQICENGPAPHLFITTPWDHSSADFSDEVKWSDDHRHVVNQAFFVCQRWIEIGSQQKWLERSTLVSTTAMGGAFGLTAGATLPHGGALAGLMKAVFVEFTVMREGIGPRVLTLDSDSCDEPRELATHIFQELASGNLDYEVSWSGGRRQVPTASERPLESERDKTLPRGTWVVTGGARGITAACALELGKRYGLNLHLIGTTPLSEMDPAWRNLSEEALQQLKVATMIAAKKSGQPAPQAWAKLQKRLEVDRSLQAFAEAGIKTTYHACDIANPSALADVLSEIRRLDGPITGVLHGAGFEQSCRMEKKRPELVERTIGVKVDGAANLMSLTSRDPIRHFITFGSIAGRLGSFGQADYCVANELVSKLMGTYRRQRPWIRFTGIHWHGWGEVGMAARPETQSVLQEKGGVKLMPLSEGVGHLIREIEAGLPQSEIMITERRHWEHFAEGSQHLVDTWKTIAASAQKAKPTAAHASEIQGNAQHSLASRTGNGAASLPPLVQTTQQDTEGFTADIPLDPVADPFLALHRLRNKPLLPAVIMLEALGEAASLASGKQTVAFRNVEMLEGMLFHNDNLTTAKVRVANPLGTLSECSLTSDFRNRSGGLIQKDRLYFRSTVELADARQLQKATLPDLPNQWQPVAYPEGSIMFHGAPFRCLREMYCDSTEGWGSITALPLCDLVGEERVSGWQVPSAVLDSALCACGWHLWLHGKEAIGLPRFIERLELGRSPREGEKCYVHFVCREIQDKSAVYDFTLIGDDSDVIVRAVGYRKVIVAHGDIS